MSERPGEFSQNGTKPDLELTARGEVSNHSGVTCQLLYMHYAAGRLSGSCVFINELARLTELSSARYAAEGLLLTSAQVDYSV